MTFEIALKSIFERGTEQFNDGSFASFEDILIDGLQYHCPEIKTQNFYTPETNLISRDRVLKYWSDLHAKFDNQITSFKYINVGKVSHIRCFYEKANFTLDVEMHFNEYAKVFKIINKLQDSPSLIRA